MDISLLFAYIIKKETRLFRRLCGLFMPIIPKNCLAFFCITGMLFEAESVTLAPTFSKPVLTFGMYFREPVFIDDSPFSKYALVLRV
jgi:hypothetical protein